MSDLALDALDGYLWLRGERCTITTWDQVVSAPRSDLVGDDGGLNALPIGWVHRHTSSCWLYVHQHFAWNNADGEPRKTAVARVYRASSIYDASSGPFVLEAMARAHYERHGRAPTWLDGRPDVATIPVEAQGFQVEADVTAALAEFARAYSVGSPDIKEAALALRPPEHWAFDRDALRREIGDEEARRERVQAQVDLLFAVTPQVFVGGRR